MSSMRVSLVVPQTVIDVAENKRRILASLSEAFEQRPDLIVLPETVITGYQDNGEPDHDRTLCEDLGGDFLRAVRGLARSHGTMISIGFFEKDGEAIRDSSVIFGGDGEIVQHYRRVDTHWRNREVDPSIYRCGDAVLLSSTAHGSLSTLLCGDLFNDEVLEMTSALRPDLLYQLAANPEDDLTWEEAVDGYYTERLRALDAQVLMVNLLECGPGWPNGAGTMVGGACVINARGERVASLPTGAPGILTLDVGNDG